jgi:transposase InsO family protein
MELKLVAIEAVAAGLAAQEVEELVGVSDTSVRTWVKQHAKGGVEALRRSPSSTKVRKQCLALEERILARRKEHPEQGVRRIRDELKTEGLAVSAETVRTVVNEAGLGNPPADPRPRPPQERRFERPVPNALWQIDIFTFQLKRMYPVFLVGIIDDHSRYLVGWGLYRQQTAEAVLEVVKGAIGQWGAPREILSDNGRQFVAWQGKSRFQEVLRRQGIGHVRSAPHHPMTLGKIERFWKTIWTEFLAEAVFASFADATQRIDYWISYYNHQRPHQGIDGATPAARFFGVAGDREEALRQGCKENALRLALGQEPQPPLYLLGQVGGTDVRVLRRGDAIEVKIGEAVHEVVQLGSPFRIDADGQGRREGDGDRVEGPECGGAVPGGGVGPVREDGGHGDLCDLRGGAADPVQGDGCRGAGGRGGPGAEEAGEEAEARGAAPGPGVGAGEDPAAEGAGAHAAALGGGEDDPGDGAEDRPGGVSARGDGRGEKETAPAAPETATGSEPWWTIWDEPGAGRSR